MSQKTVDLRKNIFLRIDEKNSRKTSVLWARILGKYENEQNTKYFTEFFRQKSTEWWDRAFIYNHYNMLSNELQGFLIGVTLFYE